MYPQPSACHCWASVLAASWRPDTYQRQTPTATSEATNISAAQIMPGRQVARTCNCAPRITGDYAAPDRRTQPRHPQVSDRTPVAV